MITIWSIEKNKDKWFGDKFACRNFCREHDIDIWDDESLEDEIYDTLWGIAETDDTYNDYLRNSISGHDEVSEYISKVCGIIWDGVINAR